MASEGSAKRARKSAGKKAARKPQRSKPLRQYGAIPVRLSAGGRVEVLLLTSRGTGRWVIPKGWPMRSRTAPGTARREVFEEAGIKGQLLSRRPIGSYRYRKSDGEPVGTITVSVYVLLAERQLEKWPESRERRTRWFLPPRAAALVHERALGTLIRAVPKLLTLQKRTAAPVAVGKPTRAR